MYQPYPSPERLLESQRAEPPQSVRRAVWLMYAGAGLEVLALIIALVTIGSLKSAILRAHPDYTAAQLHSAEVAGTFPLAVGAVITIGLWLWMARANAKGKNWARIVSAVFFGINSLDLATSIAVAHAVGTLIIGIVIWFVGLVTILLIFSKESRPFYHQEPAPSAGSRAGRR
jgi:hypothetical protein